MSKKVSKNFDAVQSPKHYTDTKIEVIDYIEDKNLGFCLGNAIKYISRAGRKNSAAMNDKEKAIQDLEKLFGILIDELKNYSWTYVINRPIKKFNYTVRLLWKGIPTLP